MAISWRARPIDRREMRRPFKQRLIQKKSRKVTTPCSFRATLEFSVRLAHTYTKGGNDGSSVGWRSVPFSLKLKQHDVGEQF